MKFLDRSLQSIAAAVRAHPDAELILVDHQSTDGSWEFLNTRFSGAAVLLRVSGGSVSSVRNRGVARASGEYLSFIDSDCVVPEQYLSTAVHVLAETGAVATGSMVALPERPHWIEDAWISSLTGAGDGPVRFLNSGNFFVRADAFLAVGGFDERLLSGEDSELCQRLREKGGTLFSARSVRAVHLDNAKSITAFFRKERWRGLGQLGTVNLSSINRPFAMTLLHLTATIVAAAVSLGRWLDTPRTLTTILASQIAVPALSLVYRGLANHSFRRPFATLLLYWLFYWARISALPSQVLARFTKIR